MAAAIGLLIAGVVFIALGRPPLRGVSGSQQLDGSRVVDFAPGFENEGYRFLDSDGHVHSFGDAKDLGSPINFGRIDAIGLISRSGGYLAADARGALTALGMLRITVPGRFGFRRVGGHLGPCR